MPTAIIVPSDPQSGSDEALGRHFNAVPGTNGLPSLRMPIGRGLTVLTF